MTVPASLPLDAELADYFANESGSGGPDGRADGGAGAQPRSVARPAVVVAPMSLSPFWRRNAEVSASFARLVPLPGELLPMLVGAWWSGASAGGRAVVAERLRLDAPTVDRRGGWSLHGSLRPPGRLRWLPVVVELCPLHDRWTTLGMRPEVRYVPTERYFRAGHEVLARLTAELAAQDAARSG